MYEGEGQRSLVSHIVRTLILWGQNPPLYHHLTSVIPLEATAVNRDTLEATASTQKHEFCENTTLVQHSSSYLQYLAESEIPKETPCVFFGHYSWSSGTGWYRSRTWVVPDPALPGIGHMEKGPSPFRGSMSANSTWNLDRKIIKDVEKTKLVKKNTVILWEGLPCRDVILNLWVAVPLGIKYLHYGS